MAAKKTTTPKPKPKMGQREEIARRVLQGLYSNIADAQKFADYLYPEMALPKAFTLIAYAQADVVLQMEDSGEI